MDGKSVSGVVPDSSAQALPLVDGSTTAESSMVTPWSAPCQRPSSARAPLLRLSILRLAALMHGIHLAVLARLGTPTVGSPRRQSPATGHARHGLAGSNARTGRLRSCRRPRARCVRALPLSIQVEDGRLLLRFTRPLAAGRVALDPQVSAVHLWAVGSAEGLSCS